MPLLLLLLLPIAEHQAAPSSQRHIQTNDRKETSITVLPSAGGSRHPQRKLVKNVEEICDLSDLSSLT
jgi:hypothetical protein